jgi:hypothetical protein
MLDENAILPEMLHQPSARVAIVVLDNKTNANKV